MSTGAGGQIDGFPRERNHPVMFAPIHPAMHASLTQPLRALAELAVPSSCAACREPGPAVCQRCAADANAALWAGGPRESSPDPRPPGLPLVTSTGRYAGALARVVAAVKDEDRRDLVDPLGVLLAEAVDATLAAWPAAGTAWRRQSGPVLVVPVPSSRAARRRRGDAPVRLLAGRAVRDYAPTEVMLADVLRPRRRVADQAGLSAVQRAVNLEHSMQVSARWQHALPGAVCVVVDDVLTTGATLVEATRALTRAGAVEVRCAVVCATQRRHRTSAPSPHSAYSR